MSQEDDDDDTENGHLDHPPRARRRRVPFSHHQDPQYFENGGWVEYRRLILAELEHINEALREINAKIDDKVVADVTQLQSDLAMLKVRSGLWGAAAAVATTVGIVLIYLISGNLKVAGH